MKKDTMKAKVIAALAARNNELPGFPDKAWALVNEVGLDRQFLVVEYDYDLRAYLPRLCLSARCHKPTRKQLSVFFYTVAILKGVEKPALAVKAWMGSNPMAGLPFNPSVGLRARARARPLTPSGRGYRSAVGIEIEGFTAMDRNQLVGVLPICANAIQDNSIRAPQGTTGAEVVCLLNRDEMEPRLFRLCGTLAKVGFSMNKSCGLHVHLDARHLSFEEVCSRAKIVNKWLSALRELVPLSRRDNSYCAFGFSRTERYRAVNVCSYGKYKTLEIRLHSATANYQKVLAWIRLCELLFSLRKLPKAGLACMATLESLPIAEYERAYWRARHAQLNPSQYAGGAVESGNGGEE